MTALERFLALVDDWKRGDLDAVTARMAPGFVWHFAAATRPPAVGLKAARKVLEIYRQMQTESRLTLFLHAETETHEGARLFYEGVEDFDTPQGHRVQVPCAAVVEFDRAGLVTGWRDYYDRGLLDAQLAGSAPLPDFARDLIDRPALG